MSEIIYGKNAVIEAIKAKRKIFNLYILKDHNEIISLAKNNKINYKIVDKEFLRNKAEGVNQGVVAEVEEYKTKTIEMLLDKINKENPFLVMLDSLEDTHNLGAILRTSDAFSVDGVIIPKNRSVKISGSVARTSTGAIEYVDVVEVVNLTMTLKKLKEKGYWVVGAEYTEKAVEYDTVKYDMPVVLVIGSEGKGISRLVLSECDYVVKIPMSGHVNSLNASVSAAIIMAEIYKYRR